MAKLYTIFVRSIQIGLEIFSGTSILLLRSMNLWGVGEILNGVFGDDRALEPIG
jgi:uncharacterized membrane protein